MSKIIINEDTLTAFGDKIRAVEGSTGLIPVTEMAGRIGELSAGEGLYAWKRTDGSGNVDYVTSNDMSKYPYNTTGTDGYVYEALFVMPGLYDANNALVASWDELIDTYGMDVSKDYTTTTYKTDTASPYYVLTKNTTLSSGTKLIISDNITNIGAYAFGDCSKLDITELPTGLTSIGAYAFRGCSKLDITELPAGLTNIGSNAFRACSKLNRLIFKSTPNVIDTYAFANCPNLQAIVVPWAEGAVAGAPWGFTAATIYYNCTDIDNTLISFTTAKGPTKANGTYNAKIFMTWTEWIDSDYNTIGVVLHYNEVSYIDGDIQYRLVSAAPSDMIKGGATYSWVDNGPI